MWHQQDALAYRVEPLLRRSSHKPLRLPRNKGSAAPRPRPRAHSPAPRPPTTPPATEVCCAILRTFPCCCTLIAFRGGTSQMPEHE